MTLPRRSNAAGAATLLGMYVVTSMVTSCDILHYGIALHIYVYLLAHERASSRPGARAGLFCTLAEPYRIQVLKLLDFGNCGNNMYEMQLHFPKQIIQAI